MAAALKGAVIWGSWRRAPFDGALKSSVDAFQPPLTLRKMVPEETGARGLSGAHIYRLEPPLSTLHALLPIDLTLNKSRMLFYAGVGREYQGSIVRHGAYVFLDVAWLATILKPLLNHRDGEDPFSGSLSLGDTGITLETDEHIASWKRLKHSGVLEPALARVLWPNGLSEYVLPTLDSLGLTHPLDGDSAGGLVVLLRLGKERPEGVGKELDDFRHDHRAVLSATWKVFMGVPPGAIEKVLARCCGIGVLRTFWRFGVLIQGGFDAVAAVKTFALLIEYSHDKTELDMKVYGDICTAAPWAALSHGLSVVREMCLEFPGLRWRASLRCPQHDEDMQISNAVSFFFVFFLEHWRVQRFRQRTSERFYAQLHLYQLHSKLLRSSGRRPDPATWCCVERLAAYAAQRQEGWARRRRISLKLSM